MQVSQPEQSESICVGRFRAFHTLLPVFTIAVLLSSDACADGLVRITDKEKKSLDGKIVSLTKTVCSVIDRQGRLHHKSVRDLRSVEKINPKFHPETAGAFRQALREEFKGDYEVAGTAHYLVCAPTGRASQYAELFESIYRDVDRFYRVRDFRVTAPDVPLVAIVFRTQSEFAQYCRKDNVPPSRTLMGYYSLLTNRVALFDDANLLTKFDSGDLNKKTDGIAAYAAISGNTAGTVIHETTHQVGYNIGIHSRLGETPVWVVEGLATVLEPAGMRKKKGRQLLTDRVNTERAEWFENRHRPSRRMGNLAKLVASDDFFFKSTLNSYSEAWAFTFFLMENPSRRQEFVKYLQKLSKRPAMKQYTAKDRLVDFSEAFGDIGRLEVAFIRYLDRM